MRSCIQLLALQIHGKFNPTYHLLNHSAAESGRDWRLWFWLLWPFDVSSEAWAARNDVGRGWSHVSRIGTFTRPSTKVNINMMLRGTHFLFTFSFPIAFEFNSSTWDENNFYYSGLRDIGWDNQKYRYVSSPTDLLHEVLGCSEIHFLLDFGLIIFTIAEAHILPETNPTLAIHLQKGTTWTYW